MLMDNNKGSLIGIFMYYICNRTGGKDGVNKMLNEVQSVPIGKSQFPSGKTKIILFLFSFFTLLSAICSAQWVQVSSGMGNNARVFSLAFSGNTIFAGTDSNSGVYLSTNDGGNWIQTPLNNRKVYSLLVNGNNIFAGTNGYGVYLSTNNGASWTQTSLNSLAVYSFAVNGNSVFAGTFYNSGGIYLSTNNGASWTQISVDNRWVYPLAVNGNNIFAGTNSYGVYLSTNNGASWTQTSLNDRTIYSLAVNGNNVFAGTYYNNGGGVYLSTNNGTNWTQTSLINQTVYSLAVSVNYIFAGTDGHGVYVSNNNGINWTQRNEGLGSAIVRTFCILNNYIFAGTYNSSVYRRPLGELIGIQPISGQTPAHYSLEQNYPNPFNPATKIIFALPKSSFATLVVYDILGREVAIIVNEQLNAGTYEADWNAGKFSSGVYYYKLSAGDYIETKKMVLLK